MPGFFLVTCWVKLCPIFGSVWWVIFDQMLGHFCIIGGLVDDPSDLGIRTLVGKLLANDSMCHVQAMNNYLCDTYLKFKYGLLGLRC